MPSPVLVTGATGFIASRIIEGLLARGRAVRGTVRSLKKPEIEHLRQLPGAAGRLELVEADLLQAGSFEPAVAGCEFVIHAASPYSLHVRDPQRDLVDPAVNGTREVLGACARALSVRRVVVTSSMAAVTDEPDDRHILTEADWNTKSSLERNPYYYSKTLAERAAWTFVAQERPGFGLVTVNPFMVIGPALTPSLNTSNQVILDLLKGRYPGILALTWGFVDVRDVADAHIRAIESTAAQGRYLCAGEVVSMRQVVAILRSHGFGSARLPSLSLDSPAMTAVMKVLVLTQPKGVASYLRTHLGRVPRYSTNKIRAELGQTFRPVEESLVDAARDLQRWGRLPSLPPAPSQQ